MVKPPPRFVKIIFFKYLNIMLICGPVHYKKYQARDDDKIFAGRTPRFRGVGGG